MYILHELNRREKDLINQLKKLEDGVTYKEQLAAIYKEYQLIYQEYLIVIGKGKEAALEALKRAIFFQWIAVSEPSYHTGISSLDPADQQYVFKKLEEYFKGEMDYELKNMLLYYYSISDWYFNQHATLIPTLIQYVEKNTFDELAFKIIRNEGDNRGQMSTYWLGLHCPIH